MNSFYGGVEPLTSGRNRTGKGGTVEPHASTFHGSQSGATSPGPSNPAGCHLSYATAETLDGRDFDNEGYFHE